MPIDKKRYSPDEISGVLTESELAAGSRNRSFLTGAWLAILVPFALLWFVLVSQLRVEWTVNPQYSYGWIVPLLCIGLLIRRCESMTSTRGPLSEVGRSWVLAFALCALFILPARLVLEANPNWRTPQWLLAGIVTALTLMTVSRTFGSGWARQIAFPVCFILVAVAWPPSIEIPLIQGLTRANVAITIEILGWLGIPASQHGNVIEISTGMAGVNEACSGIRSFQSSLMISLFLGEFYRLTLKPRLMLIPVGLILAFAFNVCRTTLLVSVAAKNGIAAIDNWHDPAGVTITVACTLALWAIAWLLFKNQKADGGMKVSVASVIGAQSSTLLDRTSASRPQPRLSILYTSLALLVWLVAVEGGVELWYRSHESPSQGLPEWSLHWPPQTPSFSERPIPAITREMLKYQEGHFGAWLDDDNKNWLMYYFKWLPGKIAASSARSHTPDVCLTAAGKSLRQIDDNRCPLSVHSLVFPFRRFEYEESGQTIRVFHCLWDEDAPGRYSDRDSSTGIMALRLNAVAAGRRNLGQRSIEIMVADAGDEKSAEAAVVKQLEKLVTVEGTSNRLRL